MDCPVCKTPMIVLELDQVEIDYCTECRGIWLDEGELEILLGNAAKANEVLHSFTPVKVSEALRKCPICLKKMQKVSVGNNTKTVLIDGCPKSHGLWFDRGELVDILKMGHFDKEGKVTGLLSELFNMGEKGSN